jgi:D-alanyl-D-alanine carboxypeptidase (penicillin-binding protein 5/6)
MKLRPLLTVLGFLFLAVPDAVPAQEAAPPAAPAPVPVPAPPDVPVRGYILMDFHSGHVLAENNPDARMEPASITKLMTAYAVFKELAAGNITMDQPVRISERAWRIGMQGSRMFVEPRMRPTVEELLQGMIIQSGNDASVALAEHVAGSEQAFVDTMNRYAADLGMNQTHFRNTTGLPEPDHFSSARDIARLARALISEFPEFYRWYSVREYTYNDITQQNRNPLLRRDPTADGIKTGWTESAGYCLAASAERGDMRLISVVLGAETDRARADASEALLNFGFRFYETHRLYAAGEPISTARVWKGSIEDVGLGIREDLWVTVPKGSYEQLSASVDLQPSLLAPIYASDPVGALRLELAGTLLDERPVFPLSDVPEGTLWQQLSDSVLMWFE